MEFITGKCPKCQGELQIPEGRDTIICMYCGEEISVNEALGREEKKHSFSDADREKYQEYADKAKAGFPDMLLSIKDPIKDFNKKQYEDSFWAYETEHGAIMDIIEDAYMAAEEPQELLDLLAESLISRVVEKMEGKSRRKQEDMVLSFNMGLVIYVDPALIEHNKASGTLLVDTMLKAWKKQFPKTNLKAADFATINSGFKRRFCYITTAVCNGLGKPDDCYELNLLREYRDNYLSRQPEGEELIRQYYDVAPTIVKHINKQKNSEEIYWTIWKDYLHPCIVCIENDENEVCKRLYRDMMDALARKYFF